MLQLSVCEAIFENFQRLGEVFSVQFFVDFFFGGENFFVTSFARSFIREEGELTCGGFFLARASFRML